MIYHGWPWSTLGLSLPMKPNASACCASLSALNKNNSVLIKGREISQRPKESFGSTPNATDNYEANSS